MTDYRAADLTCLVNAVEEAIDAVVLQVRLKTMLAVFLTCTEGDKFIYGINMLLGRRTMLMHEPMLKTRVLDELLRYHSIHVENVELLELLEAL